MDDDTYDEQIDDQVGEESEVAAEAVDECQFFRNFAAFYLKLQAKLLLPASVIQTIMEDVQQMHNMNQSHLFYKLQEKLQNVDLSKPVIIDVIQHLKCEDLFRKYCIMLKP